MAHAWTAPRRRLAPNDERCCLRSFDKPFGVSILEAMAMAKPAIASDTGGALETIQDGENGVRFRTGRSAPVNMET